MENVEVEGDSIDDAIARALQRLGVSRDKVEIEIVSSATRGLFGFGGKRARVRARLRAATRHDGSGRDTAAANPSPTPAPAPVPRIANRLPPSPRPAAGVTKTDESVRPVPPPAARRPPRPQPQPRPARVSSPSPPPASRDQSRPEPPSPPPAQVVERAQTVLAEIVRLTGVEATVGARDGADAVRLVIDGDPQGVLIGRRGQTLDAIEYLVNRIVGHDEDSPARLIVDAQGYRARRQQALEALAHRLAERARRRGKPVTLNPMSPRDRRIVHLALQGDPTLTTRSAGTGHYRKLVIVPNRK